jgi:hypothetical protein
MLKRAPIVTRNLSGKTHLALPGDAVGAIGAASLRKLSCEWPLFQIGGRRLGRFLILARVSNGFGQGKGLPYV